MVDENGVANLPRLGPVSVYKQSPAELKVALTKRYEEYLRNPTIEVLALRRVDVLGAVRNPGLYPVDLTMKVADALALAGGVSSDGRMDRIELHRGQQQVDIQIQSGTPIAAIPLQSGDQIIVPQRSWLSRNTWAVGAAITVSTSVLYLVANH